VSNGDRNPKTWNRTGYMEVQTVPLPDEERIESGPVAVIECPQEIPCDPCSENCPVGAIELDEINQSPRVDGDRCTGCSVCVESCPGLAIFVVDCSPEESCRITLPFEFELPEAGEEVDGLNRKGEEVTSAIVESVKSKEQSTYDTSTVTVLVGEEHVHEVRNIRRYE